MAKTANKKQAFVNELNNAADLPKSQAKEPFQWHKPVVAPDAAKAMNTPRRMTRNTSVASPKSDMTSEFAKHVAKRTGKC